MESGIAVTAMGLCVGMMLLTLAIWWQIFGKAGYPAWYAILMFVPIANLIGILMLAFGDWPVLRELRRLRTISHTPIRHHFDLTR